MCSNPIDPERGLAVDASASPPELEQRDRQLAHSLGLPLWRPADRSSVPPPDLLLGYDGPVLELKPPPPSRTGGVRVDFASAALKWRLQGADLLLKAVRGRSRGALRIVDATAGLGRDSFALAARGHQVLMVERSPVVAALLANGLERAQSADPLVVEACRRLCLRCGDARDALPPRWPSGPGESESQALQYDVVYLDPMFPGRENQALAKKEMQLLQRLLDPPDNEAELLAAARACAHRRVVVKRPRKSPPLAGQAPDYQLSGRAIRFDVYVS